ncbi:MAG: hypothetical protein NTV34_12375 [Proteobacteria bacterium]|nr:hypothetical protein [Pseudomonadota bacterium]
MLERQKSQGLPTGDTTLRGAPMVSVSFFSDGNLPEVYLFLSGCKA